MYLLSFKFLGGDDFNCNVDHLDRNHIEPDIHSRRVLSGIIGKYDFIDIWCSKNGNNRQFS